MSIGEHFRDFGNNTGKRTTKIIIETGNCKTQIQKVFISYWNIIHLLTLPMELFACVCVLQEGNDGLQKNPQGRIYVIDIFGTMDSFNHSFAVNVFTFHSMHTIHIM